MSAGQAAPALQSVSKEIRSRLELAGNLRARLSRPSLPAARESVAIFWSCLHSLSARADLGRGVARTIDAEALYRSFDAFLAFRAGEAALAASLLLRAWSSRLTELSAVRTEARDLDFAGSLRKETEVSKPTHALDVTIRDLAESPDYTEWLVLFHQAVEQVVAPELGAGQARTALRSLMARLELSQDDLGRMLGVSGETIRRWEGGSTAIPAERRSAILAAEAQLRRLQDLFVPERLPTVIRRSVEIFGGESALDWILRGRISEAADRYETAFLYQA